MLTLAQVAWKDSGCPTQGQVGWSLKQPDVVEVVLAQGSGVGLEDL